MLPSRCSASPPLPAPLSQAAALAVSGIAYGVLAVGYPVAVARYYYGVHTTAVYARIFTAWGLAGITAPVAAGALFYETCGYETILVVRGVVSILGALSSAALPPAPVRPPEG